MPLPPPNPEIKRFFGQANSSMGVYAHTGDAGALISTVASLAKVNELLLKELSLALAGDNPPPGLLAKIQVATQAYQTWMTCLKSCADSKGQIQRELARF